MEQYTELQKYRINYITDRKVRIINRLKDIKAEISSPDILYEEYKKLDDEKKALCKEFDELAAEYKEIVQARHIYNQCRAKAIYLKNKWGF